MTTPTTTTLDLLQKFVDQRPGLNFADYGDVRAYRNEAAEITRDRADFYELRRLDYVLLDHDQGILYAAMCED